MLTTYYSLARDSAVLFERCYVNKWYYNDLAFVGIRACVKYLKHIIDMRYESNYDNVPANVRMAMGSIDLESLTAVLNYNLGLDVPLDIIRLINSVSKYADIDAVGVEENKITKEDMALIQKAIESCKKLVEEYAPVSKRDNVNDLLSRAEGNSGNVNAGSAQEVLNSMRSRPYAKMAADLFNQSMFDVRRDVTKASGIRGFVSSMIDYLFGIIENTPGWLEDAKQADISIINKEMSDGSRDISVMFFILKKYMGDVLISENDQNQFKLAMQVYEALQDDGEKLYIRDDWIDTVRLAAISAKRLYQFYLMQVVGKTVDTKMYISEYENAITLEDMAARNMKDGNRVLAVKYYGESAVRYLLYVIEADKSMNENQKKTVLDSFNNEINNGLLNVDSLFSWLDQVKDLHPIDEDQRDLIGRMASMYLLFAGSDGNEVSTEIVEIVIKGNACAKNICELYLDYIVGRV